MKKTAQKWGTEKFKNWAKELNKKEQDGIKDYTNMPRELNMYLRQYSGTKDEKNSNIADEQWAK